MKAVRRKLRIVAIYGTVWAVLFLSACSTLTQTPSPAELLMVTPLQAGVLCEACAQATLAAALTQGKNNADYQAAATAEVMRADAQATLNSANETLSVAQTQDQNNANVVAAQIASTAEIERGQCTGDLEFGRFNAERRADPGCDPANPNGGPSDNRRAIVAGSTKQR